MGLDIYFRKVKPSKGVNANSVEELSKDLHEQAKRKFQRSMDRHAKAFEKAVETGVGRELAIMKMAHYVRKMTGYDFYSRPFLELGITNERVRELIESTKKMYFPKEDVYFRKANFVYRYFQPYLVDEACIVTQEMVTELLDRCDKVIEAAQEDGVLNAKGRVDKKYYVCKNFYDLPKAEQEAEIARVQLEQAKMPNDWTGVAADLLPTTDGFFFGSIEYGVWYLEDIVSCKEQFTKLLKNWKPNEVVYNRMSW